MVLYVNACARKESRTDRIARALLRRLGGEREEVRLAETALQPLFSNSSRDIIFDCANLDYIASSGLRIMLSILKSAKANGHKVVLKDVNDEIKNVFKLTGFISLFDFE